jgi:hypothetical protein
MNTALEFHDSDVRGVYAEKAGVTLHFSAAYIHRSEGRPGIDSGAGYAQAAKISFGEAHFDGSLAECLGRVSDGHITVNGECLSLVSIPFSSSGPVQATFVFQNGATLRLDANSIECYGYGPSQFIENFHP